MNDEIEVPVALTAQGDGALARAVALCRQCLVPDERVALRVALKKNLQGNAEMTAFVSRSGIEVMTGRGLQTHTRPGPLIMLAPRVESIDEQVEYSRQMTALFVIGWGPEEHCSWAERVGPRSSRRHRGTPDEIQRARRDIITLKQEPPPLSRTAWVASCCCLGCTLVD